MGRQAPGANNVVDGLLRFAQHNNNVELIGFINGVNGIMQRDYVRMTRETFKNYVNLGGIDYIGRGRDSLRTESERSQTAEVCRELELDSLILVGATGCLTDCVSLAQYFVANNVATSVLSLPCSVDGNIHHKYF